MQKHITVHADENPWMMGLYRAVPGTASLIEIGRQ